MKLNDLGRWALIFLFVLILNSFVLIPYWFGNEFFPHNLSYLAYLSGTYLTLNPLELRLKILVFSGVYAFFIVTPDDANPVVRFTKRFSSRETVKVAVVFAAWNLLALIVDASLGGWAKHMPLYLRSDNQLQLGLIFWSFPISFWWAWFGKKKRRCNG